MKIRISDMLDNASELIEENIEAKYTHDNKRIKKIVFLKDYQKILKNRIFFIII